MSVADVIAALPWRVGAPAQCGLYTVSRKGGDVFIGVFRDPAVARYVCDEHNEALER